MPSVEYATKVEAIFVQVAKSFKPFLGLLLGTASIIPALSSSEGASAPSWISLSDAVVAKKELEILD